MKFSEEDIIGISKKKAEAEGRLEHRAPGPGTKFRERYFKLVGNLLFYFRINEFGALENEPMGVLVIENFVVNVNSSSNAIFGFEIQFLDEAPDRKHVFTTRTEESMKRWVKLLRLASCYYWKEKMNLLMTSLKNSKGCNNQQLMAHQLVGQASTPDKTIESSSKTDEDLIKF